MEIKFENEKGQNNSKETELKRVNKVAKQT